MAVIKAKPEKIVQFFLGMLQRELLTPLLVTRVSDEFFKGAKDDTVTLRIGGLTAVARDYEFRTRTAPIVLDDIEGGEGITVKLDTHSYSATGLTDEHMTLDDIDFAKEVLVPQVAAVAGRFEAKVVAGLRAANVKHTMTVGAGVDPHLLALEAVRLMNSDKVAPVEGRTFLIGTDLAAQWLASDRLSRYDSIGQNDSPAVRAGTIGALQNIPVRVSASLLPEEGYLLHKTGLVLGNVAPVAPRGAAVSASASANGFAMRWLMDYDAAYLRDRSIVSSFLGINDVRDERQADGTLVEEGPGPDTIPGNADDIVRKNVRIIKINGTAGAIDYTP